MDNDGKTQSEDWVFSFISLPKHKHSAPDLALGEGHARVFLCISCKKYTKEHGNGSPTPSPLPLSEIRWVRHSSVLVERVSATIPAAASSAIHRGSGSGTGSRSPSLQLLNKAAPLGLAGGEGPDVVNRVRVSLVYLFTKRYTRKKAANFPEAFGYALSA